MSNSDDLFRGMASQGAKNLIDSINEENKAARARLALSVLGIIIFCGAEAAKVVFRKNFGKDGVKRDRVFACALCFIVISILSFIWSFNTPVSMPTEIYGTSDSYYVVGVLFMALAIHIFVKGRSDRKKAQISVSYKGPEFSGDSSLLRFLIKDGWKQSTVQKFAEPFLILSIGFILAMFNLIGGIAIMCCAVSTWLYLLYDWCFTPKSLKQNIEHLQNQFNQSKSFTEI